MKVAIYCRVSLDKEKDDKRFQDPANQYDPLKNWAKDRGWEVVEVYVDKGSGANPARPQWRKMMKDAMMLKFKAILVWKLDRFSREGVGQVFAYIKKLKTRGVAIKSMTEEWLDTSQENPFGELILAVMSWAASWERQKISERTKAGIQRRKNIGVYKGGRAPNCKRCKKPVYGKKRKSNLCQCEKPIIREDLQKKYQKKGGVKIDKRRRSLI